MLEQSDETFEELKDVDAEEGEDGDLFPLPERPSINYLTPLKYV